MREVADALGISHQRVHQLVEGAGGARRWRRRRVGARDGLACSFCGRGSDAVGNLVAGPDVHICDGCAPAALEVALTGSAVHRAGAPMWPVDESSQDPCSFCGKQRGMVEALVAGPRALICAECLALCQEIIAEELNR